MWRNSILFLLAFAVAVPASAQNVWQGDEEYDLYEQARSETDPARQVETLLDWEARYPNSDFERERLALLAEAYRSSGQTGDAFARAADLLRLDPRSTRGAILIAMLAQSLASPTAGQISIAEEAANELLRQADNPPRRDSPVIAAVTSDVAPPPPDDAETQKVGGFLGELRESHPIRQEALPSGNGDSVRRLANATLAWVDGVSN